MPVFAVGVCGSGRMRGDEEEGEAGEYVDGDADGEVGADGDADVVMVNLDEGAGVTKKNSGEAVGGLNQNTSGSERGGAVATNSGNGNGTAVYRQGQGGHPHGQVQSVAHGQGHARVVGKSEIPLFSVRETFRRMF